MNILELYNLYLYSKNKIKKKKFNFIKKFLFDKGYFDIHDIDNIVGGELCKCDEWSYALFSISTKSKTILYYSRNAKVIKIQNRYAITCTCSPIEGVLPINLFKEPYYTEMPKIKSSKYKLIYLQ